MQLDVSVVMTRDVVTVGLDDSLASVREIFETHRFHHLIVIDRGSVVGVVSDRDLLKNLSPFIGKPTERHQDLSTLNRRVHQVMTRGVVTIRPETDIAAATRLMLEHGVSCLPVVDDAGRVRGILSWRDLLKGVAICGLDPQCRWPNSAA